MFSFFFTFQRIYEFRSRTRIAVEWVRQFTESRLVSFNRKYTRLRLVRDFQRGNQIW